MMKQLFMPCLFGLWVGFSCGLLGATIADWQCWVVLIGTIALHYVHIGWNEWQLNKRKILK